MVLIGPLSLGADPASLGWESLTGMLPNRLGKRPRYWVPLRPGLPRRGGRNAKWRQIENTDIQPDI